ncbi:MAG TPA: hypothetical protein VHP33_25715 [Polyangiaceae bacterium]|nr:hypothetical protein [Polyangiaceae bacterium]
MNHSSLRLFPSYSRLLFAALTCLPLGSACSDDEAAPVKPTTFGIEISKLDGHSPDDSVNLRCDRGGPSDASAGAGGAAPLAGAFSTLVVSVTLSPDESSTRFILRPANACGASKRCGYVRIQGLDDSGNVVASVDTVTTEGVLQLSFDALPTQLRATLINGVNQETLKNPDKTDVTTSLSPNFVVPAECGQAPNAGGAGGATGDGGSGGAQGGAAGETTNQGGAAGEATNQGGAAGEATNQGGAAGEATNQGGAAGQNSAGDGG